MTGDTIGRPMEILLVEDDLEDAGLTISALREGDVRCRVSLVRDGGEAMELLHRRGKYGRAPRPDLILLDLKLPKKDGREVLAEVKTDERLQRIPVVVLTVSRTHEAVLKRENLHRSIPGQAGGSGAIHRRGQIAAEVLAFRRDPAGVMGRLIPAERSNCAA